MEMYEAALKRIIAIIVEFEPQDIQVLNGETPFSELGLDSLDAVEVVMAVEDEFGIELSDEEANAASSKTIAYFTDAVLAKLGEKPGQLRLVPPAQEPRKEPVGDLSMTVTLTASQASEFTNRGGEKWLRKSLNTKRKAA